MTIKSRRKHSTAFKAKVVPPAKLSQFNQARADFKKELLERVADVFG